MILIVVFALDGAASPAQENERVRQAAIFCADSLSGGWQAAVAQRITDNAPATWKRLSRSRRKHNCEALARMARAILDAKNEIHKLAGQLSGKAASRFGLKGAARAFTEELVSNIPLKPIDAKMVAVARGIQITGILLCVMDNRDLTKCRCFIDLAVAESKERVKEILIAGMSDWPQSFRGSEARLLIALVPGLGPGVCLVSGGGRAVVPGVPGCAPAPTVPGGPPFVSQGSMMLVSRVLAGRRAAASR